MTTKEKIICAGFRHLLKTPFDSVSLNGIAKDVGISKAAIYKHFKSKDEIFVEMRSFFFNEMVNYLRKKDASFFNFTDNSVFDRTESISFVSFFCEHPGYLNYFIRELVYDPKFEISLQNYFIKEKFIEPESYCKKIDEVFLNHNDIYLQIVYRISTVNCFISGMHFYLEKNNLQMPSDFSENLYDFVKNGWQQLKPISEERMKELDKLVNSSKDVLEPSSKFFDAIAEVVKEYGFPGLTVERIASKMGLAVSTLYAHYDNKSDLIQNVVVDEMKNVILQCTKVVDSISELSEAVYVQIQSIAMYLFERPSALSVFRWLRSRHNKLGLDVLKIIKKPFLNLKEEKKFPILTREKGFEFPNEVFIIWIHTIPVSIIAQGYAHGYTKEEITQAIRKSYGYMVSGV